MMFVCWTHGAGRTHREIKVCNLTFVQRLTDPVWRDVLTARALGKIDGLDDGVGAVAKAGARVILRRYWQKLDATQLQDVYFELCVLLADHFMIEENEKAFYVDSLARLWQAEYEDYIEKMILG